MKTTYEERDRQLRLACAAPELLAFVRQVADLHPCTADALGVKTIAAGLLLKHG